MRRGGDGEEYLTISPPPEFQDPVTLPPPPIFRDGAQIDNLTGGANLASGDITAVPGSDKLQEKVCVTDFASKVSSDILNKAMVIVKDSPDNPSAESENSSDVTVVCQTHDTTNPCSCGAAPRYNRSSEVAGCDTISTTTSWEYVSKSSSLSDLTRFGASFSSSKNNQSIKHHNEISAQSSVSSSHLQNTHNGRGFLPHGIVPLPPPHRNSHHNNGFNGYRLTQKDLLQPQTSSENSAFSVGITASNDDSIPVMRSTSFNLDTGAARRYNYKYRQQNLQNTPPLGKRQQQVPNKGPLKRPQQTAIVFVAENPENGACDVYNVPFQSDIYSLPVDSLASSTISGNNKKVGRSNSICTSKLSSAKSIVTANIPITPIPPLTNTTKGSSSNSNSQNYNQNQRLLQSSSEPVTVISSVSNNCNGADATPPPPQRKNNLNRRKSREEEGGAQVALDTCNILCPPPQSQLPLESKKHPAPQPPSQKHEELTSSCKPPQRWSSLSVQQPSSSPPKKEILVFPEPLPPSSSSAAAKQSVIAPTPVITKLPPPPPPHHHATSTYSISNNALTEYTKLTSEKSLLNTSSSSNHCSSSNNLVGKTLNTVGKPENGSCSNNSGDSSKKPRSRSVDPSSAIGGDIAEHHRQSSSIKCGIGGTSANANQRTSSSSNYTDNPNNHPLPPEPIESSPLSIFHGSSNKDSTTDKRNPLGLSFLNLFRRNKSGGSGSASGGIGTSSKPQNPTKALEDNHHQNSDSEFNSLVPTDEINVGGPGGVGNNALPNALNVNNNKEDTSYYFRELPPPPPGEHSDSGSAEGSPTTSPMECRDFAASIEKVKDCGWYWGPLSSEAAEELLKNEPDGSFIVRDSSDARYIFSLTFKLHGLVRHVRIEHDQGNFSFGPLTRFKAATIVDFVEKAVAHSRSGRYLFFLHRRPVLGPMQVQLLHPYSRFMHPRSLKHMCRFVILKYVRRDLIHTLPLPKPMQDYLNTPHYYFEPPDKVGGGSSVNGSGSHHPHPSATFTNSRVV